MLAVDSNPTVFSLISEALLSKSALFADGISVGIFPLTFSAADSFVAKFNYNASSDG